MAGISEILREYLLVLGFKVDQPGAKKVENTLGNLNLKSLGLGLSLAGVARASQAMVIAFARDMERLYYASRRTDSTVEGLQAMEFGAKQIGMSAEGATASIKALAMAIKYDPGKKGLLESWGIDTNRDTTKVFLDLIEKLLTMAPQVGKGFAAMFGISPEDLVAYEKDFPKLKKAIEDRLKMGKDSGVNATDAAKAETEFMNRLREIEEKLLILRGAVAVALTEPMEIAAKAAKSFVDDLTKLVKMTPTQAWEGMKADAKKAWAWANTPMPLSGGRTPGASNTHRSSGSVTGPGAGAARSLPASLAEKIAITREIEDKHGLPRGLIGGIYGVESSFGKHNVKNKYGAEGQLQQKKGFQDDYGVTNPYDLRDAAEGAGRFFAKMMKKLDGDIPGMIASYQAGPAGWDRSGHNLGASSAETQKYVPNVMRTMEQVNHFTINGKNPEETAAKVEVALARTNADAVRYLRGAVR